MKADEAKEIGLVSRVVPHGELLAEATKLAEQLAAGPTKAFATCKDLLRNSVYQGLESQLENEREGIRRSVTTADFMEGVMAFVQKRAPVYTGK